MNELTILTDAQLDKAIEDVKERELAIQTKNGYKYTVGFMRSMIYELRQVGYRVEADDTALARLWAHGLKDDFVRLGENGIKAALTKWAEDCCNEYRSFPTIPQIKEACAQIGGDPRVEKGRRMQAEAERKMEEEHRKEMEELKQKYPDLWEMAEKKAAELGL